MHDRDVDLEVVAIRREAIVAAFQARAQRWQGVQAATLAAMALVVIGYAGESLGLVPLLLVLAMGCGVLAIAAQRLNRNERWFRDSVARLIRKTEMLKRRGPP